MEYILMHRTKEIARIELDEFSNIASIYEVYDSKHLPVGTVQKEIVNKRALAKWWSGRSIPASRQGLKEALQKLFYEQVKEIPDIRIYGDFSQKDRAAIVSLNLGEEDSGEISDYLSSEYEIDTRSGGHCAPLMHGALGTVDQGAVRFSFSHFNTEEQVECAVQALKEY